LPFRPCRSILLDSHRPGIRAGPYAAFATFYDRTPAHDPGCRNHSNAGNYPRHRPGQAVL
jgi:hypothetical protein